MRSFAFIALACLTFALVGNVHADAANRAAWCAYYDEDQGTNCGFYTRQQCEEDVSGVGGYCSPNPATGQ
jgi:Protein of unknown function (DUF3551)